MTEQNTSPPRQAHETIADAIGDAAAFAQRLGLDAVAAILREAEQAAIRAALEAGDPAFAPYWSTMH